MFPAIPALRTVPLFRRPESFSDPKWPIKVKHKSFRALAYVNNGSVSLVSRKGHVYRGFSHLRQAIGALRVQQAVLDGEIVCLDSHRRSILNKLFYRRGDPCFYAFDLLWLNGRDLRLLPLIERKKTIRRIMPQQSSRLLYCDPMEERGEDMFRLVCERHVEGVVA